MTAGVCIAQKFEAITGRPTMFYSSVMGNYGGVGWLSLYDDLAAFETASSKIASDESWLSYLDSLSLPRRGCRGNPNGDPREDPLAFGSA